MTKYDSLFESTRDLFLSKAGKEMLFFVWNYPDDRVCDDNVDTVLEKSDRNLSASIDNNTSLSFLSPETRENLRTFTVSCGRLIACTEGSLCLFLNKDRKSVDIVIVSNALSASDKTMEDMKYLIKEASAVSIDISSNGRNMVLSFTYDLIK